MNTSLISSLAHQDLTVWASRIPKIDLHRHLEGSLRLQTLADIALEHGIDLPSYDIEQLRPYVQVTNDPPDFHRFLEKFKLLRHFYTSKEAVQRIAHEAVVDAAEDHIRYLELRFNPVALARVQEFPLMDVVEWVIESVRAAERETGTRTCLILQIGREESVEVAEEIVDLAIATYGLTVRAIDLAGDEATYSPRAFAAPFLRARQAGLAVTAHAGEALGAESVRETLHYLHPRRIGHGIHVVENSDVVRMLYEREIALEVCPTSNFQTGVVRGLSLHPLRDLFGLRLKVTINTDDPSVSDTTLTDEYLVAMEAIGLTPEMICQAISNAIDVAFLPEEERASLRAEFEQALAECADAVERGGK